MDNKLKCNIGKINLNIVDGEVSDILVEGYGTNINSIKKE